MRKIDWLYHATPRQFINHIHEIDAVHQPLSDQTILEIQEKFLSNGFQYLKIGTIKEGRSLIQLFLGSMSIHHDIACLTLQERSLPSNVTNIYSILNGGGYLSSFELCCIEEYFIEHFYFDFMWIEATSDLLLSGWFEGVKKILINSAIDQHIPILVCVYE